MARRLAANPRAVPGVRALVSALCLVAAAAGCAGTQLAAGVEDVRLQAKDARKKGALRCAPRELALTETHATFAEQELDEGDYFRAREHLRVAEDSAREALRLSAREGCVGVADRDHDGVPDKSDKCPGEPEDKDGFEDTDGCPDPDNDKDGIVDAKDKCPGEPEDKDGFEDTDGCPDPDNDKDGIADAEDKCPGEPEDKDGFEDTDGCPDPDNDKDGIADEADKCPLEAGPESNGGCPKKYQHIVITGDRIELKQKIFFETNKAGILSKSFGLLAEIAGALRSRGTMRVRIEGHTDTQGPRKRNMALSQARAEAVRAHLVGLGLDGARLEAIGFGPDQPIETNRTTAGREKNRRVEFVILQQ